MHYPRSKKGFTLVEIVVAILVMALVFGMTTMLAVSISGYNKDKTHITTCHEEVAKVQTFIKQWNKSLDDAFNTNFIVSANSKQLSVKSGPYWFKNPNESFDLWYDEATKTIKGDFYVFGKLETRMETYTKISSIKFALGNEGDNISNLAKCVITLNDGSVYTMLLNKETSKPGIPVIFSEPVEKVSGGYNEFIFITSADWDRDLNQTSYENLENLDSLGSFSSAYQYAALNMIRVQVDHQCRMSLEAFTSAFGAKWQVRLFSASGKVAYGMKLPKSEFDASNHRLSFFIEEGSILFDGTPIEPMGYTRKPGAVGTLDWHDAAELTYAGDWVDNGLWWIDFNTNIFWDELDASVYEQVQYRSIRQLYGFSEEFGAGLENGMYIALNGISKHLGAYGDDDVYVTFDNSGPNGTVCIHVGLNAGNLRLGSGFEGDEVLLTFTTLFMLPDGTPIREENTFRCSVVDYLVADFEKSVSASAAGEYFTGSTGVSSGDPLAAYQQFHMEYFIHAPWTDENETSYYDLQNKSTAKSRYGLTDAFFNTLYNNVYIGLDGNEIPLSTAITNYKMAVSMHKEGENRTVLRLTIKTSDMKAASYPMDLTQQVFNIRFGHSLKSNGNVVVRPFCLPDDTPVRFITLARPAADFSSPVWLTRNSLSSKPNSSESGGTLYVDFTSNGVWRLPSVNAPFNNVLSKGQGFPTSFLNSLKNKLVLKIDGQEKTIAQWGVSNFDVQVFERNGHWAMQLQVKNNLVTGKDLSIHFKDGFVGPDGTTLLVPISFVRDGTNSWTGSTSGGVYYPNRTMSINSTSGSPSVGMDLKKAALNGTAPYYIYGKVKLENAAATASGGHAILKMYYKDTSTEITIGKLTADTDGWVTFSELYGQNVSLKAENMQFAFHMNNMKGRLTVADVVIADKNGKIIYSMANDTTLYGIGDIRNVNNVNKNSSWAIYGSGSATFPIITRGDSRYIPNRILKMTVKPGYTGGDASFLIDEGKFSKGVTYYVTGRIRANVTGKTSASTAASNSNNVVLGGAGDNKYYGTANGEWVALVNADGTPLNFVGGITEVPKTITSAHRSIGIHAKHDTTNGKMTILSSAASAKFGANKKMVVRGYYKVTEFTSLASGGCAYIGENATGKVTVKANQPNWTYFKLEWNTNTDLNFDFYNAMGYLYIANLTIEDTNKKVVYDMATDTELVECYRTEFPWAPSIWYITYFGDPNAMDFIVDKATSATPIQYTYSRTTTGKTLANGSETRTMSIHSKYGTTNGKMTIDANQFKSKIGSGTFTVRGFYKIESFTAINSGGKYEIGDGASKGMESGTANVTTWNYFELTWSTANHLNFEFHDAMGYIRLANLTIENSRYKVVYDMSTDSALTAGYRTSFPWNPSIWYITYFGQPNTVMDLSITAASSATPKQYSIKTEVVPIETVSSVKRSMGLASSGKTINAKMILYGSKFAAAKGAGTYTVRGYYKVTNYTALESSGHSVNIGTGASSGKVSVSKSVGTWTRFTLTWNTSTDLVFEFWKCTGGLYIGNLVIENSAGTWLYDLSTDTAVPSGYYNAFPKENGYWYWGYSTNATYPTASMNISIDDVSTGSPAWFNYKYTEVPTNSISDSAVKRSVSIGSQNYLQSGKMIITSAQGSAKFGANTTMIVRGYYKVTGYKATGDNPWWQIGSNANSGNSGQKTGNQETWKYFKIYWNTSKDLNFELWHCNGYMRLANLTIENSSGTILYDMSTDTALGGSTTVYQTTFPQQKGIWYFTNEGNINFMDSSISAVSSATPKQYTASAITETAKTLSTAARQMGFGAQNGMTNGKMVITSSQATAKFGANKTLIVRGYYKVTGYKSLSSDGWYGIGINASSGSVKTTGNQETWKYFKLTWNTSKDLNFEFYKANGYMYLTNLTIETSPSDRLGDIVYDMSTDTNLYKDGTYIKGFYNFPQAASIWYITRENVDGFYMDFVSTAVKSATPKQYDEDFDYLKFSMWYATGTMEIADLTIYHYNGSTKVIDYSMATDSTFNSDSAWVNNNGALFSKWMSWEWVSGGSKNFNINVDYYNNITHHDTDYQVPKFTDVVG